MDKNRVLIQFDTLVKLVNGKSTFKTKDEELSYQRNLTGKILSSIEGIDRQFKDSFVKNDVYVESLINGLNIFSDSQVILNLVKIISEVVGKPSSAAQKRASYFIGQGVTRALLQVIQSEAREQNPCEDFLLVLHHSLLRVASKDKRIGVRARLCNCLGVLVNLLRSQVGLIPHSRGTGGTVTIGTTMTRTLSCLLQLLKLYSHNLNNASKLGRSGIIVLLTKIIHFCPGKANIVILKQTLACLQLCVRTKSNASKAVNQGAIAMLLDQFTDWNRIDTKQKQLGVRRSLLGVIKNLINLKAGKKALLEADGLRTLYGFCDSAKNDSAMECLVTGASLVMRKCFPKNRLPVSHYGSVLRCPLPYVAQRRKRVSTGIVARRASSRSCARRSVSPVEGQIPEKAVPDEGQGDSEQKQLPKDFVYPSNCVPQVYGDDVNNDVDGDDDDDDDDDGVQWRRKISKNLFKSLDKRMQPNQRSESGRMHQIYMNQVCGEQNELVGSGDTFGLLRENGHPDLDLGEDAMEQLLGNQIYEALDDRALCQLIEEYQQFIPERDFKLQRRDSSIEKKQGSVVNGNSVLSNKKYSTGVSNSSKRQSLHRATVTGSPSEVLGPAVSALTVLKIDCESVQDNAQKRQPKSTAISSNSSVSTECLPEAPAGPTDDPATDEFTCRYIDNSALITRSLGRFTLLGYPDLFPDTIISTNQVEPLTELDSSHKPANFTDNKILDDLRRLVDNEDTLEKTVYDLDRIVYEAGDQYHLLNSDHSNKDELLLSNSSESTRYRHLKFESQFESGNLRKAIQIRQFEYDLILNPDINTNHHIQWFYFRVTNMESTISYRFNIINCEKPNSQFNFGMQPVLFSVKESLYGRGCWKRTGSEMCYYKNHFSRSAATCGGATGKTYYTCSFMIQFPHQGDVCYLAYHYPYTYTRLLTDLSLWKDKVQPSSSRNEEDKSTATIEFCTENDNKVLFSIHQMCCTLLGNPVPLLTITNRSTPKDNMPSKKYVFLTSRVHPGESNSSWMIRGCIDYLLGDSIDARLLRDHYVFKIVPMLNPDGVINGCHRCSMAAHDLNRKWMDPCDVLNPTIYHTKGLMMLLTKLGHPPLVYCDFHGHSRRKNVFMFGCSSLQSWILDDFNNPTYVDFKNEDTSYLQLPIILSRIAPAFSLDCCNFTVDKVKESTGRVVVWRQFGVVRSYTVESSYSGCDRIAGGCYNNVHMNINMLQETGAKLVEGLLQLAAIVNNTGDMAEEMKMLMKSEITNLKKKVPARASQKQIYVVQKTTDDVIVKNNKSRGSMGGSQGFVSNKQENGGGGCVGNSKRGAGDDDLEDDELEEELDDELVGMDDDGWVVDLDDEDDDYAEEEDGDDDGGAGDNEEGN